MTVGELLAGLVRKHPSLLGHLYYENGQLKEHFLLTHKGSLVNLDGELSDGDEVEVMLATSGGSGVEALSDEEVQRYVRHITLPGVGREGQQRLKQARVLIIGTGGLGSPACLYLAAAGVGTIGLVDFDVVESSNLQRQVVHGYSTLGMPKVESAQRRMQDLNPYIEVVTHRYAIDADNAQSLIQSYDLVLDGTDNFATRYLVNAVCAKLGKPLVFGAIYRFEGQVSVFNLEEAPATNVSSRTIPRLRWLQAVTQGSYWCAAWSDWPAAGNRGGEGPRRPGQVPIRQTSSIRRAAHALQ
ncbi:ThiF family adenylyltransferase [Pseudomonas aeruginosa]